MPATIFGYEKHPWVLELSPDLFITVARRPSRIRRAIVELLLGFRYHPNPPPGLVPRRPESATRAARVPDFPPLD